MSERPQTALMVAARGRLKVNDAILWANLHLFPWLSLARFVIGWMDENNFARTPTAAYGVVLLIAAIASWILQRTIIAEQGHTAVLPMAQSAKMSAVLSGDSQTKHAARLRWRQYRWWNRDRG